MACRNGILPPMDDPRARADARLEEALAAAAMADPRGTCRDRLKALRAEDPSAFEQAVAYFDTQLVPAILEGGEPLAEWLAYGRFLAERGGPGRVVAVDAGGRARPYEPPPAGNLVLFLPQEGRRGVIPLLSPASPSPAQTATYDLLVRGRREL